MPQNCNGCRGALYAPERLLDGERSMIRTAFARLLGQGWTDVLRARHPTGRVYTFWDYKRDRRRRDAGLRIGHILLSPWLHDRLRDAGVDRDVRGREGASDHAPVWAGLAGDCRSAGIGSQ